MTETIEICPSAPFRGEREGPVVREPSAHGLDPWGWEGEVGLCELPGIPHLTLTLSAPNGGEGI